MDQQSNVAAGDTPVLGARLFRVGIRPRGPRVHTLNARTKTTVGPEDLRPTSTGGPTIPHLIARRGEPEFGAGSFRHNARVAPRMSVAVPLRPGEIDKFGWRRLQSTSAARRPCQSHTSDAKPPSRPNKRKVGAVNAQPAGRLTFAIPPNNQPGKTPSAQSAPR